MVIVDIFNQTNRKISNMKFRIIKDCFRFRVQKKYKIGWVNYYYHWLLPFPIPIFRHFDTIEEAEEEIDTEIRIRKAVKESGTVVKEIEA